MAKRSNVRKARKRARQGRQSRGGKIVDDAPVLLKLRNGVHLFSRSENRTASNKSPSRRNLPPWWPREGHHRKTARGVRRVFVIGPERTSRKRLVYLFSPYFPRSLPLTPPPAAPHILHSRATPL